MNGEQFRELIGGVRSGVAPTLLRSLLGCLELPYASVVALRNACYDSGIFKTHRLPVPTVSVGNLTLGGTGKSPMVAWLGRFLLDSGFKPGLISRGYGKAENGVNDEYLELAFRLPTVPHRQNPNRVAAAQALLAEQNTNPVDVLILDDAMQHRRIGRDFEIVLLDSSEPFGFEHIFPRGTLRESISSLRRADVVLLSRADRISVDQRKEIQNRVLAVAPHVAWGEIAHVPDSMVSAAKNSEYQTNPIDLTGRRILGFCGIGNPKAFGDTLKQCGAEVVELVPFPDHHRFTPDDFEELKRKAEHHRVDFAVCTMKDLVKLDRFDLEKIPVRAVAVSLRFLHGEESFRKSLQKLLKSDTD